MPYRRHIPSGLPLAMFLALLACPIPSPAADQPSWLEINSAHFTVITDAGDKKGREVALRFEQMRSVFAGLLSKDRLNQPLPLTILAFNNDKDYYQVAPLREGRPIDVPGFLLAGEDQDFIVLNLSEEESWLPVAQDFAQMLLNDNYPPAQRWFDEGLTEYSSSIRVDNKQAEIGGDPELRSGTTNSLQSFTELLNTQTWLSLPDLFTTKQDASADSANGRHSLFNAESWIVMHYLLHEKKLPETGVYFAQVLNQHISEEDAIKKAYGMTAVQMQQAVKDYFHSQTTPDAAHSADANGGLTLRFPAPIGPDDSAMTSKSMPEADERSLYAEVEIRIPERRDVGLKELETLATQPTEADKKAEVKTQKKRDDDENSQLPTSAIGNELAHRILAWDHIEHGEFNEAIAELGSAAILNQRDMWVRYYLSALKYRMAQANHTDIQGLPNMMLDLKAVLEWYPELAGAYDLLALARNEGGSSPAAMQAERAAMTLSPRNERYVYHLAQIYIASKKWEAADALLDRLKNGSDPELAKLARDRQDQTRSERKYGIPGAAASQPKLAVQKSPFDVLDEDAAKRAAAEKTPVAGGPGDKRTPRFMKGRLLDVDCSTAPAAILTVNVGGSVLKLRASDYKSLLLIGADDFSCEWHDRQVTVNYKPGGAMDGDLVSLEVR
jgi:Flp pilus assembly protein TadD